MVLVLASLVLVIVLLTVTRVPTSLACAPFVTCLGFWAGSFGLSITEEDRRRKWPGMVVWRALLNQLPLPAERAVWVLLGVGLLSFGAYGLVLGTLAVTSSAD